MDGLKEKIITEVKSSHGFSLHLKLSQAEINIIRKQVSEHWLEVIDRFSSDLKPVFKNAGIENYHKFSHLLPHQTLWSSLARTFSQKAVNQIRVMPFMKKLAFIFGEFTIGDEEYIGRERIVWRLVRPFQDSDVGPMHADAWFWELGYGDTPSNVERLKVWIPIYCEPGLNGLNLVPGSHTKKWSYHAEMRMGHMKPQFDESQVNLEIILPKTNPGDAIIFNDQLLHRGVLNRGEKTRVSMEFTLFVDKNILNLK